MAHATRTPNDNSLFARNEDNKGEVAAPLLRSGRCLGGRLENWVSLAAARALPGDAASQPAAKSF